MNTLPLDTSSLKPGDYLRNLEKNYLVRFWGWNTSSLIRTAEFEFRNGVREFIFLADSNTDWLRLDSNMPHFKHSDTFSANDLSRYTLGHLFSDSTYWSFKEFSDFSETKGYGTQFVLVSLTQEYNRRKSSALLTVVFEDDHEEIHTFSLGIEKASRVKMTPSRKPLHFYSPEVTGRKHTIELTDYSDYVADIAAQQINQVYAF